MAIENLLRLLKEHKVKFVIIGAAAFPVHGYARATLDVDLFIEPSLRNVEKCLAALKAFGYDISDISIEDLLRKKVLIRQYTVEVDIHPFVKGVEFQDIWRNRAKAKIGNVLTSFASLNDLIKMKKAAGRAKEKEDLKILLAIKKN